MLAIMMLYVLETRTKPDTDCPMTLPRLRCLQRLPDARLHAALLPHQRRVPHVLTGGPAPHRLRPRPGRQLGRPAAGQDVPRAGAARGQP